MKIRLDTALVERGILSGRDRAKGVIMAGLVYVDNQKADKPGMQVDETNHIEYRGDTLRYVSRGGLKLEKAMQHFPISLQDSVCMDIGASTGGFTDCMLQNGASRVYAVDVGYGQLAWKLRTDERVVNLERTNIRKLSTAEVPVQVDFISIDVSFISLGLVLPVAHEFLKEDGTLICLVKPQFEAGKEHVGKKGVVRDPEIHHMVVAKVVSQALDFGFIPSGLDFSPIKGPEGNIEYLLYLTKSAGSCAVAEDEIRTCIQRSHQEL